MLKFNSGSRIAVMAATVAIAAGGCATAVTTAGATPTAEPTGSVLTNQVGTNGTPSVIVLTDGFGPDLGIWRFQAPDKWVALGPAAGYTAIGGTPQGIVVANLKTVDARDASKLSLAGTPTTLKWPGTAPVSPVVAVDRSASGALAIATSDGQSVSYAVATSDGKLSVPAAAPKQSFTPAITWLDETRLLTLSTDNQQVSRIAVLDTKAGTLTELKAISGITGFALSGDKKTLVAATESALYAQPVTAWLAGTVPLKALDIASGQVVWDLALNGDASALAMLSGIVASDGKVAEIHEVGYAVGSGSWTKAFDVAAPFHTAKGQVWVG